MQAEEDQIRTLILDWVRAIQTQDLDGVLAHHAWRSTFHRPTTVCAGSKRTASLGRRSSSG
jgi:ketosteroid isomerase-like protein